MDKYVTTQVLRTRIRGTRALRLSAAALLALLPLVSASARVHHTDAWSREQFARAERMREALNGRPADQRSRSEYQRLINAYRHVYFGAPASAKADPSVVATAELMVEMGRQFDDNKILRGAIEQYRFLRKEYPGSKYRFDALFTIGEIYKDDLGDPEEARTTFENFLHRYPRHHLADDAAAAIREIDADADEMERAVEQPRPSIEANGAEPRRSQLPRVTGVRYWSTPDYTRVAIDVEREVKFSSERLVHPDRVYFDLKDSKLASTLVGKTFDVDDGFLKKVRVAEFQPGRTRVVLEVDDLKSYNVFLLPNPYRLIIDIHGKQKRATLLAKAAPETPADARTADSAAGEVAPLDSAQGTRPTAGGSPALASEHSETATHVENAAVVEKSKVAEPLKNADAAVATAKIKPEEIDLPASVPDKAGPVSTDKSAGVVKTTVSVPGSSRKIPKTIVPVDDDVVKVATLEPDQLRPELSPVQRAKIAADKSDNGKKANSRPKRKRKAGGETDTAETADLQVREAQPTAAGDRSLIRALGLKIGKIVIDAGHGGHDTGTIGPNGLREKDLVLDVSKRLGRLLESRLGAEVIYTRQDDTFIPLETRTAIANRERADLFISIHANSSRDEDARGVETYYLNFTSSPEALEVAARENAVSEKSIYELQDLVKKIALKEKIEESREFASDVQTSLYGGLSLRSAGVRNRGVKKAPFIVLIGANMPSILAEISFVSNPTDERKLETAEHRQRIAEALYRGVAKYANGLSGVKVASRGTEQTQESQKSEVRLQK